MNAIIFSAGLGTRLQPLTNNCPKALVKLNQQPLLWYAIQKLIGAGAKKIIVNIHHFGDQIINYINENHFDVPILISDERNLLLDTGGGLLNAKKLFDKTKPIIAMNVDVISSVNFKDVIDFHNKQNALATLVVRKRETSRYFQFNNDMLLCGWKNIKTGEEKTSMKTNSEITLYAFSGIQIISPIIFDFITEKEKFSIVELYLRLAKNHKLVGYNDQSDFWLDVGKTDQLAIAEKYLTDQII